MEDRSQEILGSYELKIYNTYRTRGAYVLETDQGLKLLCGYEGGESRVDFEDSLKQQIIMRGYVNVDGFVRNTSGSIISVNSVGEKFIIKDWFEGEECSMKKEDKILLATSNLAELHNCMTNIELTTEQKEGYAQTELMTTLEKRTSELKRVKRYIRERKQRNEFENCYLSICEEFYKDALNALALLAELPYAAMLKDAVEQGLICHGSYTYHNIFLLEDQASIMLCRAAEVESENNVATTNFEKAECGLQITDLYYFMRKVMEKNDWNIELGKSMMRQYQKEHELSANELKLLYVLLLYPEKFWKITNYYYNSKKSWIPQKNVQKLVILGNQMDAKKKFLKNIFVS